MYGPPQAFDPQQPSGRPPVPGPPRPPQRDRKAVLGAIAGGALIALVVLIGVVSELQADGPAAEPTSEPASAPAYEIVDTSQRGMSTDITVEVEQMPDGDGLEEIFSEVRAEHDGDGGYFVMINCSTGAPPGGDNRLAYGRYAVGDEGQAVTGLKDGGTDFKTFPGRECPAP